MKATAGHAPNAITQRLDKLSTLWQQFLSMPNARVCRWLIEEDENAMMDTFIGIQSEDGRDFVFELNTPFTKSETYGQHLSDELSELIEGIRPALQAEGFPINWYSQHDYDRRNPALGFVQNINALPYGFETLDEDVVFVFCIKPTTINKEYETWLMDAIEARLDPRVRFLVIDRKDGIVLDKLAKKYTGIIHTIQPDLDMPAAIRQLAASGNPADPGVKFRKAFVELTQAAGKLNMDAVNKLAVLPLSIATENNWMPMQVAVQAVKGNTLLNVKRYNEALQVYDHAYHLAAAGYAQGDEVGGILTIQLLFAKATVFISMKNFKEAADTYNQAAQRSEALKDYFQMMEAHRMEGFSYQQMSKPYEAWDAYNLALLCAEQMDTMTLENSTFPYVGQALMDLAQKLGKKQEYFDIDNKMTDYIGKDWKDKIAKRR
jgi:tetratricopeptide (TPR) repeat protein